jgi:hypothetical protein
MDKKANNHAKQGMPQVNGWFYFRLTESGNLIGEYANDKSTFVTAECAEILPSSWTGMPFEGIYITVWQEDQALDALLSIKKHGAIYELIWIREGKQLFTGRGAICDGKLVGNYKLDGSKIVSNLKNQIFASLSVSQKSALEKRCFASSQEKAMVPR